MAPNSLSPASVVIDYHSLYGPHKMTIPTREWFPTAITGELGSYSTWNNTVIDGETMVRALITWLKAFMTATASFDQVTAYTQATAESPNIPRASVVLGIAGISTNIGNQQAVSATWNFKTTGNGNTKLVLLDTPIRNTWFAKIHPATFDTDQYNVINEFENPNNAWSGRDDNKPDVCRSITYDLNDKLQAMYFR